MDHRLEHDDSNDALAPRETRGVRALVAIVGLFALAALGVALGLWQLERAEASREAAERFAAGAVDAPLREPPVELAESDRFRRLEVSGAYQPELQFLLDNALHAGQAGYHVLTPLRLEGTDRRLLVNRGWVTAGADRRLLPDVTVASDMRTVEGRLERLPRPGMRLGSAAPAAAGERVAVVQYPTAKELETLLDERLYDFQLLLDPAAGDGYVRDWRAPGIAPERNLAYAGQWLLLAAGAAGAGVVLAVKASRRKS